MAKTKKQQWFQNATIKYIWQIGFIFSHKLQKFNFLLSFLVFVIIMIIHLERSIIVLLWLRYNFVLYNNLQGVIVLNRSIFLKYSINNNKFNHL